MSDGARSGRSQARLWNASAPGALGDDEEDTPTIEPFLPSAGTDVSNARGAIIICPGGGYTFRAPHEAEPVARWLQQEGIGAFILRYRVAPYRHPIPSDDLRRAIRLVRFRAIEWGIDPSRVGVLGFSAGGHLAATVGTRFDAGAPHALDPVDRCSCRPDCLVLCYPVISFGPKTHRGSVDALLGANPPSSRLEELSNELYVSGLTPASFLWHCSDDDLVPVENSLLFAQALGATAIPFELHVFDRGGHGKGLAVGDARLASWTSLCAAWLHAAGW